MAESHSKWQSYTHFKIDEKTEECEHYWEINKKNPK